MRNELETTVIERDVELCEDSSDLREILRKYDSCYLNWQSCINRLLDESGLSYNRLAGKCGISKNTLKKWCCQGGAPRSRNTFLKIGFGLGMSPAEVNRLLTRYGGYHSLYAKDLFDAVCIFTLQRRSAGGQDAGRFTFAYAEELYRRCLEKQTGKKPPEPSDETFLNTETAAERIREMKAEEDFLRFSADHGDLLTGRGQKLAAYLQEYLLARDPERRLSAACGERRSAGEPRGTGEGPWPEDCRSAGGRPHPAPALNASSVFSALGIPRRFEKIWSMLTVHGTVPRREQLIALALHLEMAPEEVNRLLELAGMEALCAKDRLECVVIYALQQMCLLHPEIVLSNAIDLLAVTRDEGQRKRCREIVEEYTRNCYQCSDEEADSVSGYVRDLLRTLDLDEAEEFLSLI